MQSSECECKCGRNSECAGVSAGCHDVKCEDDPDGSAGVEGDSQIVELVGCGNCKVGL